MREEKAPENLKEREWQLCDIQKDKERKSQNLSEVKTEKKIGKSRMVQDILNKKQSRK